MRTESRIFLPLLIFGMYLGAPSARVADATPRAIGHIESELQNRTLRGFSGTVLIVQGDKVLLNRAYGSIGSTRIRTTSRFWIASASKQFTSAAVLKCQEQQLLLLADPISKYLPHVPPDKQAITLFQLLSHQSGLPQNYAADGTQERSVAVAKILAQHLDRTPGSGFRYSNDNYELAAAIVEIASGRKFEEYVTNELLRPAELVHTGFAGTSGSHSVAPAKNPLPQRLQRREWGWLGAGGMFSTTHDLYRWYNILRNGNVFTRDSVTLLFSPAVRIQEGSSGLGWFLGTTARGSECVFTRGNDDFGANSLVYAYPDKRIVVIVLTHAGNADETSWSRKVLEIIEDQLQL